MSANRTIRRVSNLKAQRMEAYRYWQSRSAEERMEAIEEVVRNVYFAKGIDLDRRPSNRKLVRVVRPDWKAA
jgi:dimeric dUTPase (all-alpha-NTP-PPase superfamily)